MIREVGPELFNSMCSDDTGNTHNTRAIIQASFKWILNMPDPCHVMSNLIKDITAISYFKPVSDLFFESHNITGKNSDTHLLVGYP